MDELVVHAHSRTYTTTCAYNLYLHFEFPVNLKTYNFILQIKTRSAAEATAKQGDHSPTKDGESDVDSKIRVRPDASAAVRETFESIMDGANYIGDMDTEESLSLGLDSEPTARFGESHLSSPNRVSPESFPDSKFSFPESFLSFWCDECTQSSSVRFVMGNEKNAVTVWSEIPTSDDHLTDAAEWQPANVQCLEQRTSSYIYGFFLS